MTPGKRAFDLTVSLLLGALLLPVLAVLILILLAAEGRPVFYIAERMKTPTQGFGLIKLRTMRPAPPGANAGVTGGDKSNRMSRLHRILRRTRADEIPQLWNVIRGDMSLVGPRPPLRLYVEAFPDIYGPVLQSRPASPASPRCAITRSRNASWPPVPRPRKPIPSIAAAVSHARRRWT